MVLDDPFRMPNQHIRPSESPDQICRASALARVSSLLVDLILFFPLLNLAFVPFYRAAQSAALLDEKNSAIFSLIGGFSMMAAAYVVATSLFLWRFQATPGQKALGLRVVPGSAALGTYFLRQCWVVGSLLLGGLPLVGVVLSRSHQSWGDKVTGSFVEAKPLHFQARYRPELARWGSMAVLALVLTALAGGARLLRSQVLPLASSETAESCPAYQSADLEKTLTLFSADLIDATCLDQHANLALHSREAPALAYLAKSIALSSSPLSDTYLAKVCEPGSDDPRSERACQFARLIKNWSQWAAEKSPQVRAEYLNSLEGDYAAVWGARQLLTKGHWHEALSLLDRLSDRPYLADFVQLQKVKALLASGERQKVAALFEDTGALWRPDLREEVAQILCSDLLDDDGCEGAYGLSCQSFLAAAQQKTTLSREQSAQALLALSCAGNETLARSEVWQGKLHSDLVPLWKAVQLLHQGDRQRAQLMMAGGGVEFSKGEEEPKRSPSSQQTGEK